MITVNTIDLRRDLGEILNRVQFRGEKITIFRHGRPIAVLSPMDEVVSDPTVSIANTAVPTAQTGHSAQSGVDTGRIGPDKTPTEIIGKPRKRAENSKKTRRKR